MQDLDKTRIDKWLWAVRIFKTRSIASEACKKGHVLIDGIAVKSSRLIKIDEIVNVKFNPIVKTYKVKQLLSKRLSAKLVVDYVEDVTPEAEINKLKIMSYSSLGNRDKGLGRPTKKDRRTIEKYRKI
ncbi:MAG: RNA-binding S4 domain-containing protein [Bacteroidales bacterium]|nr:RNA-binding S4 domain-containing protein [Bacteroidales bacterium]